MLLSGNRLYEHYVRVVRPDMLGMFGGTATLASLEVSMILDRTQALDSRTRYMCGCLLELVTGKRPKAKTVDVFREGVADVLLGDTSGSIYLGEKSGVVRQSEREKRALLMRQNKTSSGDRIGNTQVALGRGDSGLKLKVNLVDPDDSYGFLEKLREFYLPEPSGMQTHVLDVDRTQMLGSFFVSRPYVPLPATILQTKSKLRRRLTENHAFIQPLFRPNENPLEARTTYLIRTLDLMKFPDVEMYFEALVPVLSKSLFLHVRPYIKLSLPADTSVDSTKMMTWFLSSVLNPFSQRLYRGLAPLDRRTRLETIASEQAARNVGETK